MNTSILNSDSMLRVNSSSNTTSDIGLPRRADDGFSPTLFSFAEKKKWRKLCRMLKRSKYKNMCSNRDTTGLSLLNIAVFSDAPFHIIDAIIQIDPTQAYLPDCFGATPLHLACLNGASPSTIQKLVRMRSDLVKAKDRDHRVPLHHAVECVCRNEISFDDGREVIRILCEVDSSIIHNNDSNSHSPLDIVQIARTMEPETHDDSHLQKLYTILCCISKNEYLRKKRDWEGRESVTDSSISGETYVSESSIIKSAKK